uniref:Uncharacterized protein n=1 Tax=Rhizophora mucronata TaxID=61149 RepID=A0A2P2PCN3_RHIMU
MLRKGRKRLPLYLILHMFRFLTCAPAVAFHSQSSLAYPHPLTHRQAL